MRITPKLNYSVINKKQEDQMQLSLEKRLERRKWINHTPCQPITSYQSMDCLIKWVNQFINSTKKFFICLKTFSKRLVIMQRRKSRATANEFITEKTQEAVSNTQHWLPIFCQNFQIFCCKIQIFEKIK